MRPEWEDAPYYDHANVKTCTSVRFGEKLPQFRADKRIVAAERNNIRKVHFMCCPWYLFFATFSIKNVELH